MNPLIGQPSCPGNLYDYDVVPNLDSGSNLDSADAREAKAETEGETDLGQAHAHMKYEPKQAPRPFHPETRTIRKIFGRK